MITEQSFTYPFKVRENDENKLLNYINQREKSQFLMGLSSLSFLAKSWMGFLLHVLPSLLCCLITSLKASRPRDQYFKFLKLWAKHPFLFLSCLSQLFVIVAASIGILGFSNLLFHMFVHKVFTNICSASLQVHAILKLNSKWKEHWQSEICMSVSGHLGDPWPDDLLEL